MKVAKYSRNFKSRSEQVRWSKIPKNSANIWGVFLYQLFELLPNNRGPSESIVES